MRKGSIICIMIPNTNGYRKVIAYFNGTIGDDVYTLFTYSTGSTFEYAWTASSYSFSGCKDYICKASNKDKCLLRKKLKEHEEWRKRGGWTESLVKHDRAMETLATIIEDYYREAVKSGKTLHKINSFTL